MRTDSSPTFAQGTPDDSLLLPLTEPAVTFLSRGKPPCKCNADEAARREVTRTDRRRPHDKYRRPEEGGARRGCRDMCSPVHRQKNYHEPAACMGNCGRASAASCTDTLHSISIINGLIINAHRSIITPCRGKTKHDPPAGLYQCHHINPSYHMVWQYISLSEHAHTQRTHYRPALCHRSTSCRLDHINGIQCATNLDHRPPTVLFL